MDRKYALYCAVILGSFIVAYPQSLFLGVKNVLDSANAVIEDVSLGLRSLSAGLDFVDHFVKSTTADECKFHCPSGKKLVPNQKYKPVPTGCGAYGVTLSVNNSPKNEFTECCNYHDICYGTCLSKKEICDEKFEKCLNKACGKQVKQMGEKKYGDCKMAAKIFYAGTVALGCKAYLDAQAESCICT